MIAQQRIADQFPIFFTQEYVVYRKMPMLVTRQERTLTIDGVYIHVRTKLIKFCVITDLPVFRSCHRLAKPRLSSIVGRPHHTT
jgi:hypothetical protein